MHISKIYLQDNFIPNINIDQFRRKVFGMEITIKEGEDVGQAISEAETHIANYIKINTVPMDDECRGTKVRDIESEVPLNPKESLIQSILQCTTLDGADGLLSFKKLAENNAEIKAVYDLQLLKLKK